MSSVRLETGTSESLWQHFTTEYPPLLCLLFQDLDVETWLKCIFMRINISVGIPMVCLLLLVFVCVCVCARVCVFACKDTYLIFVDVSKLYIFPNNDLNMSFKSGK